MVIRKKINFSWGNNTKIFPKIFYFKINLDILRIFKNKNNFIIQAIEDLTVTCLNNKNVLSTRKMINNSF